MLPLLESMEFDLTVEPTSLGLVKVHDHALAHLTIDEEIAVLEAEGISGLDYVFFRRSDYGQSAQIAAYIIDNTDEKLSETEIADIHKNVWFNGSSPLLYVGWKTRVDILSCARGPDFWSDNENSDLNDCQYDLHP